LIFASSPIAPLIEEGEAGLSFSALICKKVFWVFVILMACAGACEQSVSQWASVFAEQGLGVSKTIGDLAGPMLFAVMMGTSRLIYGKHLLLFAAAVRPCSRCLLWPGIWDVLGGLLWST